MGAFLVCCVGCPRSRTVPGTAPFQGKWRGEADGKTAEASFERDTVSIDQTGKSGKMAKLLGTYSVNQPGDSGEIDIIETTGGNAGKTRLGIFAFEGTAKLKICLADVEKGRPSGFVATEGCKVLVFERVK